MYKNAKSNKILFALTLSLVVFWVATVFIDPYDYKVAGIIYEILWLPMLAGFLLLPLLAFIFWWHEKFNFRSLNILTIIIIIVLLAVLSLR